MRRVLAPILALFLAAIPQARANIANGTFSAPIKPATTWSAGADADLVWFSGRHVVTDGVATLPNTSGRSRAMIQSLPLPAAARYRVTFRARATNTRQQSPFLLVLAVRDGITLNLSDNAIAWNFSQPGTRRIARVRVPNAASNSRWTSIGLNFNVTTQDTRNYERLVFVFVGSTNARQILEIDDVSCDVPLATTSGDNAPIQVDWFLAPNSVRNLGAINWATPILTTSESQLNWPNTSRPFHPQVRADRFALRARGSFVIPHDGLWTFFVGSDEGITLDINGQRVISADRLQTYSLNSGAVLLTSGSHTFELRYFERTGANALVLYWQGPGEPTSEIIPEEGYEAAPLIRRTRVTRWQEIADD
jgi:hypothetical protein